MQTTSGTKDVKGITIAKQEQLPLLRLSYVRTIENKHANNFRFYGCQTTWTKQKKNKSRY